MKKKLYYVVEKELETIGDVQEYNGYRYINVYEIIDNTPTLFTSIEGLFDSTSEELINDYLEDNGYGDDIFELIQL
jgi:hypothetical protein